MKQPLRNSSHTTLGKWSTSRSMIKPVSFGLKKKALQRALKAPDSSYSPFGSKLKEDSTSRWWSNHLEIAVNTVVMCARFFGRWPCFWQQRIGVQFLADVNVTFHGALEKKEVVEVADIFTGGIWLEQHHRVPETYCANSNGVSVWEPVGLYQRTQAGTADGCKYP